MGLASRKGAANLGKEFEVIYPGTSQVVAFDASAQSAALGTNTSVVRLLCTQDCFVLIGQNPTALTNGTCMFLPAGIVEHVAVGGGLKIAAIKSSTAGNLYITEGA